MIMDNNFNQARSNCLHVRGFPKALFYLIKMIILLEIEQYCCKLNW